MKNLALGLLLGIVLTVCVGATVNQTSNEYFRQMADSMQRMQHSLEVIAQKK